VQRKPELGISPPASKLEKRECKEARKIDLQAVVAYFVMALPVGADSRANIVPVDFLIPPAGQVDR